MPSQNFSSFYAILDDVAFTLDVLKLLLKEGVDDNAKDKGGITALMEASIMGHAKIFDLLLKEGAEVDATATANSGVTALWLATGEGRSNVMKSLLKKDADAGNARSDGADTSRRRNSCSRTARTRDLRTARASR